MFALREAGQVAVIAWRDVEEEAPTSKNKAEVQETPKPKFGDFQGFEGV